MIRMKLNEKIKLLWQKFKNFCKGIWDEVKDVKTLILFIIVVIIAYSPVWVGYILYFIFKWKWCLIMATAYLAFWAGPFTPFFPLCIAATLFIKRKFIDKGMHIKLEKDDLIVRTASFIEMEKLVNDTHDEVLKATYKEMLNESKKHKSDYPFYCMWFITLKNKTHVGEMCFKGIDDNGHTELGYGINDEYQGKGYATKAVGLITEWALSNAKVSAVEAEAEESNIASIMVLTKNGFVRTGESGKEGPRFIKA